MRPLKTRDPEETAFELLHIFSCHGAPLFLNSSLNRVHVLKVLRLMYSLWSMFPTVYGQLFPYDCHTELFTRNLELWMKQNNSSNWSIGCALVASNLNSQHIAVLGSSPYSLMHRTALNHDTSDYKIPITHFESKQQVMPISDSDRPLVESDRPCVESDIDDHDPPSIAVNTTTSFIVVEDCDQSTAIPLPSGEPLGSTLSLPMMNYECLATAEVDQFMEGIKIVENSGRGECLFYVILQHLKAFTLIEYTVPLLRRQVSAYLQHNELGKAFVQTYHPDINSSDLETNTGTRRSWGGPDTLFAVSQMLELEVTLLSYICDGAGPYLSKYWPHSRKPPTTLLSASTSSSLVVKYKDLHYTLLLPKDLVYPPKSFKRKRL